MKVPTKNDAKRWKWTNDKDDREWTIEALEEQDAKVETQRNKGIELTQQWLLLWGDNTQESKES